MKKILSHLFHKVTGNTGLSQIIFNSGWLLFDDLVRIIPNFFIGVWLARYLGPSEYGQWNFALSLVMMFTIFSSLGLNNIVVRDLVKSKEQKNEILGSTLVMKIFGSLLALILAVVASMIFSKNHFTTLIVAITAFGLVFQSTEIISFWFESNVKSKFAVLARSSAFIISSTIKILLILSHASLISFVVVSFFEVIMVSMGYIIAYSIDGQKITDWRPKWAIAKQMLKDSSPIIIAGIFSALYLRVDRILVGSMINSSALGNYAVGTSLTDSWGFMATAIIGSVYPAIIYSKQIDEAIYLSRLQKLYNLMTTLSVAIALPISIFSKQIIHALYGDQYGQAAIVLSIYVWGSVFFFLDGATSKWFYIENLQKYILYKTIIGAGCSIILNLILIPRFGVVGAAVASLISSFVVVYSLNFFFKEIRLAFKMQTRSFLLPLHLYDFAKYIQKSKEEIND